MKSQPKDPTSTQKVTPGTPHTKGFRGYLLLGAAGLLVWWLLYISLAPLADWFT